ncbi:MAG TPA: hypothetical protein VHD90_26985 [Phototrophicaceae bacterium]|nr:hypothetical protein [Phototrophicaceae bacterium]
MVMNGMQGTRIRDTERVYRHICAFTGDHGYPPSPEAIANWLGFRVQRVHHALMRLRAAGRICERSTLPTVYIDLPPAA